jgi:peptidyl-prolyl cis-trans isomerase B (cyclophilin B)
MTQMKCQVKPKSYLKNFQKIQMSHWDLQQAEANLCLHMIAPYDKLFDYFVVINGGLVLKKNELLFHDPISANDMETLIADANQKNIILGMIGAHNESITYIDERISYKHTGLNGFYPKIDDKLYLKEPIYQLWVIGKTQDEIIDFAKSHERFQLYLWRMGGGDFIYRHVNKGRSIEKILKNITYDQLICIGDGDNDFQMLEMADISIAMGNAKSDELKKKADLVAPHINDDQLYDFFEKNNLI